MEENFFSRFLHKYFFNEKWCCNVCGREIFGNGYFCEKCEKELPFNDGALCNHCGRHTVAPEEYCSSCKEFMLSVDCSRSAFIYAKPVSGLIQSLKYGGKKYLAGILAQYMSSVYFKFGMLADAAVFVPMTKSAKRKRGFNQSELLCREFCARTGVEMCDCVIKTKDTPRQATLGRKERAVNLAGAFKVTDRKAIENKTVVIIDDVMTTGSTAEALAEKLKRAGAKCVKLLTAASVPPKQGY